MGSEMCIRDRVLKVNNIKDQIDLGATAKDPRWATAYKLPSIKKITVVNDIKISLGRTGVATPYAELEEVDLDGVKIKSASLHNIDYIDSKDIRIGDEVVIERAGDVIPQIIEVSKNNKRTENSKKFRMPEDCPVCNSKLFKGLDDPFTKCLDSECDDQIKKALEHFSSKNCVEIEGLGEGIINILFENKLVSSITDLYKLTYNELIELEGFQDKSANNLLDSISASKKGSIRLLIASSLNASINSLKKEGLLGEKILGTDFSFDLGICIGQGAYICGEETALIASIEGRRAEVDVRPPFPVTEGLYKKPTVVNNVETLAAAAGILLNGAEKFSAIGKKSAGTKLVCFDSFFNNPGVYEIEMGTPMKKVLYDIGGGFKEDIKALQIGGPLGGVIPIAEAEKLNLDFQEFTKAGFMLGHASIVSIPKDFPMVEYIHHLFEFTAEESCGKCFPGRLGSYRGKEMFDQLKSKKAKIPLKVLNDLLITMKKGCLCALCGAIPTPIMNILKYFGDEMKNDMVKEN